MNDAVRALQTRLYVVAVQGDTVTVGAADRLDRYHVADQAKTALLGTDRQLARLERAGPLGDLNTRWTLHLEADE